MIKTKIRLPNGDLVTVEVLEVQNERVPTCRNCKKEIRFAQFFNGKQFPIINVDDEYHAHFNCNK